MCLTILSCCFCVNLNVGARIISIISLVTSSVMTLLYGTAAMLPPPVRETRKVVYASVASISMFQVLLGSLLVYGVFRKKQRWMIPWLAMAWVSSMVLVALSVFGAVLLITQNTRDEDTAAEVSTMVSVYFIFAVILYYFTSVVNSRREELVREEETESSQRLMRQRVYPKHIPI